MCSVGYLVCVIAVALYVPYIQGQCTGETDLIIAIPGSSSVPQSDFLQYEQNMIELLRYFTILPDQFNIGLILYGESAVPILYPQPFSNRLQVNTRVTLLSQRAQYAIQLGSSNNPATAITTATMMLTSTQPEIGDLLLRPNARKIVFVFTYGPTPTEEIQNVIDAAATLQEEAVVYALSTNGNSMDFQFIGTDFCRLFSTGSIDGITSAVPFIASAICSEIDPDVQVVLGDCFPENYGQVSTLSVECKATDTHIEDPNNCAYFFQCIPGASNPQRISCPNKTLWNDEIKACDALFNSQCFDPLLWCPFPQAMLIPYAADCTRFINCDADMVPHLQSCPAGQIFNVSAQACVVGSCP